MIRQDVTNVVNTKQLDNHFQLLSGLAYDPRRSNATHKVYESFGSVLSIKDYNNDTLVELCVAQGCNYELTFVASISSVSRTL